jgi:hypothetical protein
MQESIMQEQPTTKPQLLDWIKDARAPLDRLIAQLSEEQMLQPGVENKSSVKDLLAHITTWEQHLVRRLAAAVKDKVPEAYVIDPHEPWEPGGIDTVNEYIFTRNAQLPLQQVLSNFHRSLQDVLQAVDAVSEHDLFDPDGLAQIFGLPVERVIGGDTFYHYPEHIQSMRVWLDEPQSPL